MSPFKLGAHRSMSVAVHQVISRQDWEAFIRFPIRHYAGNPYYVPYLISERKQFFDPKQNPLFEFTDVAYFLARDADCCIVGRITAHINHRHNYHWRENVGFFGFFECIDDFDVASALLREAEGWLRTHGVSASRGPFHFSTNEECGLLAEGFDRMPALMMPYNPPYYLDLLARAGYEPVKDLLAYELESDGNEPEFLNRFSRRISYAGDIRVRPLDVKQFDEEVAKAFKVYNSSWQSNWGFVPMTEAEFRFAARSLKPIVDPAITLLAEKGDEPIGFFLAVPDYNPLLKRLNGRLGVLGALSVWWGRRRISRARVMAMGVLEAYRRRGVDTLLLHSVFQHGLPKGYRACEMSWILEENYPMRRIIEKIGGVLTKRYRIFEKPL